jgi:hypothetical protein
MLQLRATADAPAQLVLLIARPHSADVADLQHTMPTFSLILLKSPNALLYTH